MKISKKAQYGLRAMVHMAKKYKDNKVVSLKEMAEEENLPLDFLEKIVLDLQKAGLLKAKKGAFGGYFLAKKPKNISAGEIVEILEDIEPVECRGCQMARICSTKSVWDDVRDSVNDALYSKTLLDLIK
ncbi:MAG: Rrf2 family transcriptional regulator [bacterium]|nr:Rrf2 family transcriptional regulator [bacterium]